MITFNSQILKSLFGLIGDSAVAIQAKSGVGRCTVSRAVSSGDCKVSVLVDLCNAYHMDISVFFGDASEMPDVSRLFVPDAAWSPLLFRPENIPDYDNKPESIKCSTLAFIASSRGFSLSDILVQDIRAVSPCPSDVDDVHDRPWVYAASLFRTLPSVLGCSLENIGRKAGRDIHTYPCAVKKGDIRVRTLLDICNTFSIPVGVFFQHEGSCVVPESLVQDGCTAQRFYSYRISDLYGRGTDYTYEQIKKVLGYTNPRMIRMMSKDTPMTACELARLCNIVGISPSWFFQPAEDHAQMLRDKSTSATISNLEKRIVQAGAENAQLKSRIRHMEAMNDLKKG